MNKFIAVIKKEMLQLIRDWPGLTILFLMPAIMLIVITLTQERVLSGRDLGMKIIMVDNDSSVLGDKLKQALLSGRDFDFSMYASEQEAENEVFNGVSQVMIVIPNGTTEQIIETAKRMIADTAETSIDPFELPAVKLRYDPAMMRIYKEMLISSIQMIIESTVMNLYAEEQSEYLQSTIEDQMEDYRNNILDIDFAEEIPDFPNKNDVVRAVQSGLEENVKKNEEVSININSEMVNPEDIISVESTLAGREISDNKPNLVDNNIPGFILFAMFFIVLPLAGSLINEKQQGTHDRLHTLPIKNIVVFSGKIIVFLLVCFIQFIVMLGIGRYIFPLISELPPISLNVHYFALLVLIIASALSAIGFGLLIGTITNTYGQAAPLGSVLVVIMAVLGGVFSPAYMMPDVLKKISIISPLRWGTDAFYNIFARNAGFKAIIPQILMLLAFFVVSLIIAGKVFAKRK